MRRALILIVAMLFLLPTQASGQVPAITLDANAPYKAALDRALRSAAKRVPLPSGHVHVRRVARKERCGTVRVFSGCALFPGNVISLDPTDATKHFMKFVVVHEAGHFYDFRDLTEAQRARLRRWMPRWVAQRGDWVGINIRYERRPREIFADYYAHCALYYPKGKTLFGPVVNFKALNRRDRKSLKKTCKYLKRRAIL